VRYLFVCLFLFGCGYEITKKGDNKDDTEPPSEPVQDPSPAPDPDKPSDGGGFPSIPGFPKIPGIPDIPGFPGGGRGQPLPPTAGGGSGNGGESVQGLADAINAARKSRGLGEVKVEIALNCAAKRHADDIGVKKICGHYGTDGSSPWDRAKSCGTSADGEIVACGQGSPKAAVDAWTMSPGHAAIMYAPNQTVIGVGMLNNYWVAIFR